MGKKNRKKENKMPDFKEKLVKEAMAAAEKEKKEKEAAKAAEKEKAEEAEKVEGVVEDAAEAVDADTHDDGTVVNENPENASEEEASDCNASDEVEDTEAEDGNSEEDSEKKKFSFFKKDKKAEKPDKRDEQIAELNDKLMRNLAEFENFRKRSEKEKSAMFEIGAKSIVEKILPALDSFDLGLAALSEEDRAGGLGQGMEKIYKQLMTSLESAGVKPIEALGKEFDPNLHNAVMHEDNEELGENVVSQELQKGYMYHDSVVRHSMVKVAN